MVAIQIITSLMLIFLVLIQSKSGGLSSSLSNSFGAYRSRRGIEKGIFITTILTGIAFTVNSLFLII